MEFFITKLKTFFTFLWNGRHGGHEMRIQLVRQVAALCQQHAVDVCRVGVHALRHVLRHGHELDW